jgi:glycosyltransferase involved in cell wall biosynthesis
LLPKIFIIYDHFLPAWKAGGPIRSIAQLIDQMSDEFSFYILTSAYDYQEKNILVNIQADRWCDWENIASVYYLSKRKPTILNIVSIIKEIQPDIIFINGLFSPVYNIKALIAAKRYVNKIHNAKIILSPRGMLHSGALSQKKIKKRLFLDIFGLIGLYKNILWHATDEKEVHYIKNWLSAAQIQIAGNFPKISAPIDSPYKNQGELIMGTLALISPMKNHLEILNALVSVQYKIVWHIFGPVKDQDYWGQCNEVVKQLPDNIKVIYHGAIPPDQVLSALEKIQVFILPSKSENFGHAILEALSAGKPVITTNTTPFTNLNEFKAGYTVAINQLESELSSAIDQFSKMGSDEFSTYQKGAAHFANNFVNVENLKKQYRTMFEIP